MRATAPAQDRTAGSVQGAAVQLDKDLELRYVDLEVRAPAAGEVRIRVEWAGLGGSDLTGASTGRGIEHWPSIQGREVFGRIDTVGPGVDLPLGIAVVADSRFPCHDCARCVVDRDLCLRTTGLGEHRPGGFATHCLLPATNVLPAGDVDGSIGVLTEPLARALHAIGMLDGAPQRVAVLGHGPLGALLHLALRLSFPQVDIVVAEPLPSRAKLAKALGAAVGDQALVDRSFDGVFDTDGHHGSLARALRLCGDGGRVVLLARPEGDARIDSSLMAERELVVRGSHGFSKELPQALRLIATHPQMFRPIVTEAIELSELPGVVRREIEAPRGSKVVIRP